MNGLEGGAKPYLEPMVLGRVTVMPSPAQEAVARWVTLKLMVAELNTPAEAVFDFSERDRFRKTLEIPSVMKIWLFPYQGDKWPCGLMLNSSTMNSRPEYPPTGPLSKNTKTMTMGFGHLLIHVFFTHVQDFDDLATLDFQGSVARIWPQARNIVAWPPGPPINNRGADYVADQIARFEKDPKVRVFDG
jgi:hypothetical protein